MQIQRLTFVSAQKWLLQRPARLTSTCRHYSLKRISLDDRLTTEIKKTIEAKWAPRVYGVQAPENCGFIRGRRKYVLAMFPYPSGRLHLGHVRVYTLSDILARFFRMNGYEVIHPMGWDAFGLPAENAARDRGIDPQKWTKENIAAMKKQIIDMGCCFDWDRELETCDPSYYKWTQWLFVKLHHEGLAYKKKAFVFWDPVDQTVLAEEQVDEENRSWRSGAVVEKKLLSQWFIQTAVFAQKLSTGLDSSFLKEGWRDIIDLQHHWIGAIHGFFSDCRVVSDDSSFDETLRVWFSSPETLRHANFAVIQPDHFLCKKENVFETYENGLKQMRFLVLNPATGMNLPVFMGGPNMPTVPESSDCRIDEVLNEEIYPTLSVNDSFIEVIRKVCKNRKSIGKVHPEHHRPFIFHPASLKLRDWLVSRQRSWGTPIPAVNCKDCEKPSVVDASHLPFTRDSDLSAIRCSHCGSPNVVAETDTLDTFFDSSWYFLRYLDVNNSLAIFDKQKLKHHLPVDVYIGGKEHATLHLYYARFMSYFLEKLGLIHVHEPFKRLLPVGVVMGQSYKVTKTGRYIPKEQVEEKDKRLVDKETGLFVTKKWEKMSKSKFNGVDPEIVVDEYGIDTTRLFSMASHGPLSARHWPSEEFSAYIKFQEKLWSLIRKFCSCKESAEYRLYDKDEWKTFEESLFQQRNNYTKHIIHSTRLASIGVVITRLQTFTNHLLKVPKEQIKDSIQFERSVGLVLLGLYPIMPAFTAQLWQSFRDVANLTENEFNLEKEIWCQAYPTVDPNYNLTLGCKIRGRNSSEWEMPVPCAVLNNLDAEIALEMALEHPEIEKIVPRDACKILRYKVIHSYRADLLLEVPSVLLQEKETFSKQ